MLLPLLVFFALQRYFVRGLTAGSVKDKLFCVQPSIAEVL